MAGTDNYQIQARQAKTRFLTYDQQKLIRKLRIHADEAYLYIPMLSQRYRLNRTNGDLDRETENGWVDANTYEEVMTLLDFVCDSREDRFLSLRWKNMSSFGLMFHQNLLEDSIDPWAVRFESHPEQFRSACEQLKGTPLPTGDIAYAIELFDGLCIGIQLWFGDEEFAPNLRYLWDENANMYIRYETMYFARGLLLRRLKEYMEKTLTIG